MVDRSEAPRIYAPLARMPLVAKSKVQADLARSRLVELAGVLLEGSGDVETAVGWSPWEAP